MVLILHVEVMLQFSVGWQDLGVRPCIVAERRPGLKILGEAALHGLTVDGTPAPDHLALGDVNLTLLFGDGPPQGPVVCRVYGFGISGMAELNVVRKLGQRSEEHTSELQ